jgi:hypothetical protein
VSDQSVSFTVHTLLIHGVLTLFLEGVHTY